MKPEPVNPFGYLARGLQRAAASRGLSLEDIATRTRLSTTYLRTLMTGCVNPRQAVLVDVAAALGVRISEVYALGEAAVEGGLMLTLCFADPSHRAEVVSKAALGVSLKRRSQQTGVLFLSLVQPADWVLATLARRGPPPHVATAADLPGLGSAEGYHELVNLIDEHRPDVVVLDNLARFHPEPDPAEKTLAWFREADRLVLRQLRQALEDLHPLEVLVVHFVDHEDAEQLGKEGLVDRVVSIDEEFLTHR